MSSLRISQLEAEGQHLQDLDSQEMGLTSDPSYCVLKKRIQELNVPRKKKCGDIPSQKDHVPHMNLKKFDADALKSDGCK
jgi:hypothetical protein